MGEETRICPKAISYDHGDEESTAWSVRWAKKQESALKPFPMTMGMKKTYSSPYFGAKTSKILPDPKTFIYLLIYLSVREDLEVQTSSQGKNF